MTTKKTRFSTSRSRASADRNAIDAVIDELVDRVPENLTDEDFEDLSDLSRASADRLAERWLELSLELRTALVREMVNRFESDIEHHFDRALIAALSDEVVDVKLVAFEGLTDTTDNRLLEYLIQRLPHEDSAPVRAAGARVTGQFVLQAELGAIDQLQTDRLREMVMSIVEDDPDGDVRLRMLESAGYFANDPEVVDAITDAWESGSHDEQVSAIRAMGHQCDPRWLDIVLEQLRSDEPEIRFEAARATATVGGQSIVPQIVALTEDEDVEVQMAAIASLGALGGDTAIATLRALEQSESVAIADAAGAAVEEALLATTVARPPSSLW
jgi:HEAT repeat protein